MRSEVLTREGFPDFGVFGKRLQGRRVQGADMDLSHYTGALQMIDRGKDKVAGNHPPAHDCNLKLGVHKAASK